MSSQWLKGSWVNYLKTNYLKELSYTGKKGKKKFSTLTTCSVIFGNIFIHLKYYHFIIIMITYMLSERKNLSNTTLTTTIGSKTTTILFYSSF